MHPFLESLKPYQLENGMIGEIAADGRLTIGDNPYLRTATAIFLARRIGAPDLELVLALDTYFMRRLGLSHNWIPKPESDWGSNTTTLSHDEISGLACSSPYRAKYLYDHAKERNWVFTDSREGSDKLHNWYWRMLYLVPAIRAIAGHPVPWLEQILYAGKLKATTFNGWKEPNIDTSGRCLIVLQSQYSDRFPKIMRSSMASFMEKTAEQFGDLSGLYRVYFRDGHPFTTYSAGIPFVGERRLLA